MDRQRLLARCEPVQLVSSACLCEVGSATRHIYFPTEGSISLVALIDGRPGLEIGIVGREGMVGAHVVLGSVNAPCFATVHITGAAWRVGTAAFRTELARSAALQRGLKRYLSVQMAQLATLAACARFHLIGPRLARRLLMSQDRAQSPSFHMTHDALAYLLGVRRVGITTAAVSLQQKGLIEYRRGAITVLDRKGLEAAACGCYAADCQTYNELL